MTRIKNRQSSLARFTIAAVAIAAVACGFVGCAPSQGGGLTSGDAVSYFVEPDASIGDVRVWLKQNQNTARGYHGTQSKAFDIVLVNESHSRYQGLTSDRLTDAERIIPDVVARRLLSDLAGAGMTKRESGVVGTSIPPDEYVKGISRRIHMWIGVEHRLLDGRTSYTFLPRYVMALEELEASQEQVKIFNACVNIISMASANSFPKDRSKGTRASDLRPPSRDR